jgi:hypothetical protein
MDHKNYRIIPLTLKQANDFVVENHRHHGKVTGHRFSLGLLHTDTLIGVIICGRPVARGFDFNKIIEVNRLCVLDSHKNACSKLYSACARISKEMGFEKIITYILQSESGTSLIASGWSKMSEVKGRSWDTKSRSRTDKHPTVDKTRWEKELQRVPNEIGKTKTSS